MNWIDKRIMPRVSLKSNRAPKVSASYKKPVKPLKGGDVRNVFIAQAKMMKLMQMITMLQSSRFTIVELAQRFDQSERSVYRYLNILEVLDFPIEKDFDGKFFICETNTCPLCGGELHHA